MFTYDEMSRIIDEVLLFEEVPLNDIPDIDLYVDQVNAFIDKKLAHLKRQEKDKLLTKTMINNYTKAGLLMPPSRKKYSREHIALLILVYSSKHILSISDISMLFGPLLNPGEGQTRYSDKDIAEWIDQIYALTQAINRDHASDFSSVCAGTMDSIHEMTATIGCEDKEQLEWFLMVMFLVSQAAMQKRLAEKIIDQYFKKELPHKSK